MSEVKVTIRLPEEVADWLRREAARLRVSQSRVVHEALLGRKKFSDPEARLPAPGSPKRGRPAKA